ncbi:MAG: hypothetical protein LBI94_07590 [Treponema sp.]|nr:hypothetical protein [Treponema sp.]
MILSVQLYRINGFKYKELFSPLKKSPYVLGILLSFLLFALSPVVTFNQYKLFSYPILPPVEKMWSVFRSTGRYTWPIIYICILFCVWWIVKNFSFKKGILVLSFLVILQGVDLKDYFMSKGGGFKAKKLWHTELESPVWPELAKTHKHIFFLDGYLKLYSFLDLATNNNMTVNDAYLARKNSKAIYDNKRREIEYLAHGGVKQDTLYVFASKEKAALLGFEAVYLYSIDNVIVGISSRSDYLNEYALDL